MGEGHLTNSITHNLLGSGDIRGVCIQFWMEKREEKIDPQRMTNSSHDTAHTYDLLDRGEHPWRTHCVLD